MSSDKTRHLTEDQILIAVVNEEELALPIREHLSTCQSCRAEKRHLQEELVQVGQMAKRSAPSPRRPISLPEERPARPVGWLRDWRSYAGAAVAAGLVVGLVWWSGWHKTVPQDGVEMLAVEAWEGEEFMADISTLAENPLPLEYLDISGESDVGFDEAFIEFVVPSTETEPLSNNTVKGGAASC